MLTKIAITGLAIASLIATADAAVISVGPQTGIYGTGKCLDVNGSRLDDPGVPVTIYDCHAAGNQQFTFGGPNGEFEGIALPGTSIYTMAGLKCLDVKDGSPVDGALVMSYKCNGGPNQEWNFVNGQLIAFPNNHLPVAKCLDAPDFNNGTQLTIATCDGTANQQFHIK